MVTEPSPEMDAIRQAVVDAITVSDLKAPVLSLLARIGPQGHIVPNADPAMLTKWEDKLKAKQSSGGVTVGVTVLPLKLL